MEEDIFDAIDRESGMSLGLELMRRLTDRLSDPQDAVPTVHIAGTNGKGSVGAYLSSALTACGYRVGRFSSPTVFDRRDNLTLRDKPMDFPVLKTAAERVFGACAEVERESGQRPTAFEIETAIAFECFRAARCDIAIIETGLGGRLDATNVIAHPVASVITSIGLDHTAQLGGTLAQIAGEKAGIIRPGCRVIAAKSRRKAVRDVLSRAAAANGSPVVWTKRGKMHSSGAEAVVVRYKSKSYQTRMIGVYQETNLPLAVETLDVLRGAGFFVDPALAEAGIAAAVCDGRFTLLDGRPVFVLDGAHNPPAAAALCRSLRRYFRRRLIGVAGIFRDKDADGIARAMKKSMRGVVTFSWDHPRARTAEDTAAAFRRAGIPAEPSADPESAVNRAGDLAGEDGVVVIFGSLSHLATARRAIDRRTQKFGNGTDKSEQHRG